GAGIVGGAGSSTAVAGTSMSVVGVGTPQATDGTSWFVSFAGSRQTTSMSTPASTTLRGAFTTGTTAGVIAFDSGAGAASWGAHTSTLGASATSACASVELRAIAPKIDTYQD